MALLLVTVMGLSLLSGCGDSGKGKNGRVVVYNWGEYIDPETLEMFEDEYGIEVVYDEYETNELMYPKVSAGATKYDVICPSDYMVQKMISEDLLREINFEMFPTPRKTSARNIGNSPSSSIPVTNILFLIAGEP